MIVLTFISDPDVPIPSYAAYSMAHLRIFNPSEDIVMIANDNPGMTKLFRELKIQHVPMDSISSTYLVEFNENSPLKKLGIPNTKYPSPTLFFHRAMERIFYIKAFLDKKGVANAWHIENDVLVYYPFHALPQLNDFYCTPMGNDIATMAVSNCNANDMEYICNHILNYCYDTQNFLHRSGADMFNEMTILAYIQKISSPLITFGKSRINYFPISSSHIDFDFIFDPGSYGQYLGGTNNEHGVGWYGTHHHIGREIAEKTIAEVKFEDYKPSMTRDNGSTYKLFNLHIHSKDLKKFAALNLLPGSMI